MSIPRHVAVVPDGNRRWARQKGMPVGDGHRAGIQRMSEIARAAFQAGVEVFTFWWGSPANLEQRDVHEVEVIVDALGQWLAGDCSTLLADHGASFEIYGRWQALCPALGEPVVRARRAAGPGPKKLVVLMGYDGREEIVAAAQACAGDARNLAAALWTAALPPVDLVIRSGDARHLSAGFMLWHIAEAQLCFSKKMWPDFSPDDLAAALDVFAHTERRFGR